MFVGQAVKKEFDIKHFIEELGVETLNTLYGEYFEDYITDEYEDYNNESDSKEYNADVVTVKMNNKPALMLCPHILPTQPLPIVPEFD